MKKILYCCMLLLGMTVFSQNKKPQEPEKIPICGTDSFLNSLKKQNPEISKRLEQMDAKISSYNKSGNTINSITPATITIPVVVYIVHNNGPENISDTQVLSQINKLNAYFSPYGIRFCMSTMNGSTALPGPVANPGIIRITNATLTDVNADTEHAALTATSTLASSHFLRIWVVKSINNGGASGYSILPDVVTPALDGIVMSYKAFGDLATCSCTTLSPSTQTGKILVHEVGHYLGLYHTFEGGCAGMSLANCETSGDMVCDTPPVSSANSGCNYINSCTESSDLPDDINNFMDYTNETCLNHFTEGQVNRMRAMITLYRSSLVSSTNQTYAGITCNGGLLASFTTNGSSSCIGSSVTFTAAAISGVTSYNWDFGDGTIGSGQIVSHTYTSAFSPAIVTLTISNGTNSASAIQSFYIENCTPINNTESNWYFFNQNAASFSTGIPVYNNSAFTNGTMSQSNPIGVQELTAVQSNASGQLLFYTDGVTVWNNNHQPINGTALHSGYSSLNGVMIVPDPGNSSQYYIITSDCKSSSGNTFRGLKYTKVQVAGTVATVIAAQTNVPITVPSTFGYQVGSGSTAVLTNEGVTAVRKSDGYWLLASAVKNSNSMNILVFNINSSGIGFTSEQYVENIFTLTASSYRAVNIQASGNGKKVAFLNSIWSPSNQYVYDFDVCNGTFSNRKLLPNQVYGAEFSPDNKLLYGSTLGGFLYQFDIESCVITGRTVASISPNGFGGIQRGPDNKLYVNIYGTPNVAVIHRPNNRCTDLNTNACAYNASGIAMQNSTNVAGGLPNMIDAKTAPVFTNTILVSEARCNTACYAYNFEADTCSASYLWSFGDPASGTTNNTSNIRTPSHIFSAAGTYTVSCVTSSGTLTTTVVVGAAPVITGNSEVCIQNNNIGSYGVTIPSGYTAHWTVTGGTISGLANQSNVVVNWSATGGVITVVLTNTFNNCTSTASRTITIADVTPTISIDGWCFSTSDYSTTHTTTIPPGYTAEWTFENGIEGTFTTPTNQANVGVNWTSGTCFGYLGLTLTNSSGCTFRANRTIVDQCACDCLNSKTYSFTKSGLWVTFTSGNSNPNCAGACGASRFSWGDGYYTYAGTHTYAAPGTYTVTITPVIIGAYDEAVCTGTPYTTTVTVTNCKGCLELGKQNLSNVTIFPNPASSVLNYTVDLPNGSSFETVLRTVDGKEILRKQWNLTDGLRELQLELPTNISDGMLFVELISDEVRETRTILIKK